MNQERRERILADALLLCAGIGLFLAFISDACHTEASQSLNNWRVTNRGGSQTICYDPILHPSLKEIECYDLR